MSGGGYTRRLEHLVPVRVPDGGGGILRSWDARGVIWGRIQMRSGGLKATEFGRAPRLGVKIRTHHLPQGHPARPEMGHRLRDGTRLYEVEAVHDGADDALVVMAAEIHEGAGA
ncbi:head-tail adaptor protein [uncultured Jannaschia sp.]|uniref:head-tail adaptor protein n=1 Tax=uncultured Jannaschia sp. TaxID=293347 RepID=UPI002601C335|nr:head-tail adaptor protein [uncultured Jannaschia sp.]